MSLKYVFLVQIPNLDLTPAKSKNVKNRKSAIFLIGDLDLDGILCF